MEWVKETYASFRRMNFRQLMSQAIQLGAHAWFPHAAVPCHGRLPLPAPLLVRLPSCPALSLGRAVAANVGNTRAASLSCYAWLHACAGLIMTSALMIWKSLMLVTGSESPVRG